MPSTPSTTCQQLGQSLAQTYLCPAQSYFRVQEQEPWSQCTHRHSLGFLVSHHLLP